MMPKSISYVLLFSTLNSFTDYVIFGSLSVVRNEEGWDEWSSDGVTRGTIYLQEHYETI